MLTPNGKLKEKSSRNPGATDRRRWFLHVAKGLTIEEIADRESVGVARVQDSIDRCKEYRYRFSNENVALRVNEIVIGQMESINTVFSEGLKAKKYLPLPKGRYKTVPDHQSRLDTVKTIKSLQEVAQPKVPLVQNNTQFNNNTGGMGFAPGMSFESRLRLVRQKKGLSNLEDEVIEDAELADTDQTLDEELEEQGISLEDDEGDEATA